MYVQNILSHISLGFKTPEETYIGKKPEVNHLNIFGFPLYVHIPKEKITKLDPSKKKGIFFGYCEVSKAFRIYILGFHSMDISRDVKFHEEKALEKSRRCQFEEVHEEDVPLRMVEAEPSPKIVASKDHDMLEPKEPLLWISLKRENLLG